MAKAQTLSELADNIVARQMNQKELANIERKEMSGINKKIHAFGGEAMLFDHISQGKTIDSVIKSLDISIGGFYKWIEKDAKRGELLARARTRGGRSLAEQTLEIADNASPQEAQVAKLRVDTRRWLASKQAPDEYGDKQQPLVNIDLGSMALDDHCRLLRFHRFSCVVVGVDIFAQFDLFVKLVFYFFKNFFCRCLVPPLPPPPIRPWGGSRPRPPAGHHRLVPRFWPTLSTDSCA